MVHQESAGRALAAAGHWACRNPACTETQGWESLGCSCKCTQEPTALFLHPQTHPSLHPSVFTRHFHPFILVPPVCRALLPLQFDP